MGGECRSLYADDFLSYVGVLLAHFLMVNRCASSFCVRAQAVSLNGGEEGCISIM